MNTKLGKYEMNLRDKALWVADENCRPISGIGLYEREKAAREVAQAYLDQQKGIQAIWDLIKESYGVAGLHLNGDIAPWSELLEGGRFEEWLIDLPEPPCS